MGTQSFNSNSIVAGNLDAGNSSLRAAVAGALESRVKGYVCRARVNQIGDTLNGTSGNSYLNSVGPTTRQAAGLFANGYSTSVYFKADPYFNSSESMCGNVFYINADVPAGTGATSVQDQTSELIKISAAKATNDGLQAGLAEIDKRAQAIANEITQNVRNSALINSMINQAVDASVSEVKRAVDASLQSSVTAVQTKVGEAIAESTKRGWMLAILYQRIITNAYSGLNSVDGGLSYSSTAPDPLNSYLGLFSGFWNSSTIQPITDAYDRDMSYMSSLTGVYAAAGNNLGIGGVGSATSNVTTNIDNGRYLSKLLFIITSIDNNGGTATGWRDPIPDIQALGKSLSSWAAGFGVAVGASDAISFFTSKVPSPAGQGASAAFDGISALLTPIFYVLAGLAFLLAGIVPLLPLVYFAGAAINWVILVIEALIAAPLWLLTYFFPSRESNLIGSSRNGLVLVLGVFMRPVLIILGLVAAMLVMRVAVDFVLVLFKNALGAISTGGGIAGIGDLFLVLGIIFMFATTVTYIVTLCCGLISEVGDAVMRWIDSNIGTMFGPGKVGQDVANAVNPAARVSAVGQGLQGVASSGKGVLNTYRQQQRLSAPR
jgi:conjugal transfer/type IV secretion protein DotA/TraY